MEHLKGLTKLTCLDLDFTHITDAGLERLKGLTSLRLLKPWTVRVTNKGVEKLQQALPKCEIEH